MSLPLPLGHDRETCAGADPIRTGLQHGQRGLPVSNSAGGLHLGATSHRLFHQSHILHRRTGSGRNPSKSSRSRLPASTANWQAVIFSSRVR